MNPVSLDNRERFARQTVESFVRRFEPSYKLLAHYAALPLLLTPELVNFVRTQFLFGQVPWIAEADLLLSDLCSQVGYELYAMDAAVRSYLLAEMKRQEGEQQMQEVARLLIRYLQYLEQTHPTSRQPEQQAQKWAAMVYLDDKREQAVREIAGAFQSSIINTTEMARLARLTRELAPQLSDYPILLEYATDVGRVLTEPALLGQPSMAVTYEVVSGVTLEVPSGGGGVNLQRFSFEVVTVNRKGKIIKRETRSAQYFNETLETQQIFPDAPLRPSPKPPPSQAPSPPSSQVPSPPSSQVPSPPSIRQDSKSTIQLDMVAIPGGKFMMGTEDEEIERLFKEYEVDYFRREQPQHEVTVQPFFMSKTPITQAQWRAIASRTDLKVKRDLDPDPSHFKDAPDPETLPPPLRESAPTGWDRPVESVSWYDAMEFCARLSRLTGREYRLPSEAEWEYACRAGTTTPFHFGETLTDKLANYDARRTYADEPKGEYREQTTPVGSFPPNAFGLYDLHGNMWEWCLDDWHNNYEKAPTDGKAWLNKNNSQQELSEVTANEKSRVTDDLTLENTDNNNSQLRKVLRGGSWSYVPASCRSADRDFSNPDYHYVYDGFRVVFGSGRTL